MLLKKCNLFKKNILTILLIIIITFTSNYTAFAISENPGNRVPEPIGYDASTITRVPTNLSKIGIKKAYYIYFKNQPAFMNFPKNHSNNEFDYQKNTYLSNFYKTHGYNLLWANQVVVYEPSLKKWVDASQYLTNNRQIKYTLYSNIIKRGSYIKFPGKNIPKTTEEKGGKTLILGSQLKLAMPWYSNSKYIKVKTRLVELRCYSPISKIDYKKKFKVNAVGPWSKAMLINYKIRSQNLPTDKRNEKGMSIMNGVYFYNGFPYTTKNITTSRWIDTYNKPVKELNHGGTYILGKPMWYEDAMKILKNK